MDEKEKDEAKQRGKGHPFIDECECESECEGECEGECERYRS